MALEIVAEHLNGLVVLQPTVYKDERGVFIESYNERDFARLGLPTLFRQDNHSRSVRNVLRGMHFQWDEPMGKLLRAVRGAITVVEVDIRPGSPTCGQHVALEINDVNNHLIWIPPGFANGFLVTSESADVSYKCTTIYNPKAESGIRWDSFGMSWSVPSPLLSPKDSIAQSLDEWLLRPEAKAFAFEK